MFVPLDLVTMAALVYDLTYLLKSPAVGQPRHRTLLCSYQTHTQLLRMCY